MRVRAKLPGYYDHVRRRPGDEFTLRVIKGHIQGPDGKLSPKVFSVDEQFSSIWMEKIDGKSAPKDESEDQDESPKSKDKAQGKGKAAPKDEKAGSTGDQQVA